MAIESLSQIDEAARLRFMASKVENRTVRAVLRWTGLATAILCVCLSVVAQNQDRDTRGVPATSSNAPPSQMRVDINHATVEELLKVPGMTRSWAGRVVRFRPYRTKADLLENGVVPSEVYDRIKDYVIAHRDAQ
jgi:DNA uptake protein ComE-like DNA-binding protein